MRSAKAISGYPELGGVALGVGVLRPEGGPEGVDRAKGHGEVLAVELAGHGEVGPLAEEVLGVVHAPVGQAGRIGDVKGGHLEHLAGALAVGGGDDGGVDVDKAPVLEEAVDGVGRHRAHPEHRGKEVGAGAQMLDGAQILHRVALFLKGIVRGGRPLHRDGRRLDLQRLLGLGGEHHGAGDDKGRAHVLPGNLLVVVQHPRVHDHLQILEAGAVVELDKAEGFHIPDGAGPAHHRNGPAVQALAVGKHAGNGDTIHSQSPLFFQRFTPRPKPQGADSLL